MGSRDQAPRTVYPRVKVREQPDPKSFQVETTDLLLKVIESLSLEGSYPSNVPPSKHGNGYKSYFPSPRSAISSPRLSNLSTTSSVCDGSEGRNRKSLDQDKKPNVRASSVPRPRAVLSSPDNDDMIGHQNRLSRERVRERPLKVQTSRGSATAQNKPTPKDIIIQSPVNKRETTKVPSNYNNNNGPKTKPSLIHEKPLRQMPAKGKPNPTWIF